MALPSAALAQASPSDFTTATRYDAERRVTGTIAPDPDGAGPLHHLVTRNMYDAAGRLIRTEKGELAAWQSEAVLPENWTGLTVFSQVDTTYDAMDRKIVERVWAPGVNYAVTQYSYDAAGRLECTAVRMNPAVFGALPASACTLGTPGTQGPDRITRNYYDKADRLLQVRKAVGTALEQGYVSYGYTPNGKEASVTDANGNKAAYTYDGHDRLVKWQFPDKVSAGTASATDYEEYGYDANGNRTSLRKRDGIILGYQYDALNRLTHKRVPDEVSGPAATATANCHASTTLSVASDSNDVCYDYDLRGLQTSARFGWEAGQGIGNTYDGFGRSVSSTIALYGATRTLLYQHDANGNRTRLTYPDGVYFSYSYDGLDRPLAIRENGNTTVVATAYDAAGRRSSQTRGGVVTSYGYDPVSRLTDVSDDLAGTAADVTTTLSYNPASQIVQRVRGNASYAFNGFTSVNRTYAANGLNQYTTAGPSSFTYDALGNLTSDGTRTYIYDRESRLRGALNSSMSYDFALAYDPLGRLNIANASSGAAVFLYDGDELVAEYLYTTGALLRRYVHGAGEDDPLLWYEGPDLTDRRSLQADHQGSIVSVADAGGNLLRINAYDEYGIPNGALPGTTLNMGRFQYTGQAWFSPVGMYYYKARMYSPTLGRFLQTDPIGYDDQVNLYAYVGNDPVNHTDPTGMQDSWLQRAADIVIGTVEIGVGALGTVTGITIATGGAVTEVGTAGVSTPVSVPAVVGGIALTGASINLANDGGKRLVRGIIGSGKSEALPKPPTGPGSAPLAERDPKRTFSPGERAAKRAEQGGKCANDCGSTIDETNSEGHHRRRWADGGMTNSENHDEVCKDCHKEIHQP